MVSVSLDDSEDDVSPDYYLFVTEDLLSQKTKGFISLACNTEIIITPDMGRALIVTRDIKVGETLFVEQPLVCCQYSWNKLYGYAACDHCLRPLESAGDNIRRLAQQPEIMLPREDLYIHDKASHCICEACQASYCSPNCREAAWQRYHRLLCPGQSIEVATKLATLDETWRAMHYPPETTTIMLLVRLAAMVQLTEKGPAKESLLNRLSQFCHTTVNQAEALALKLLGGEFAAQIEQLCQLFRGVIYEESLSDWYSYEGFRSLLALLGRNCQGIASSPFSVWVKRINQVAASGDIADDERSQLEEFVSRLYERVDEVTGCCFMDNEGVGLYERQACANHSCNPNAEVQFVHNDATLSLVAVKEMAAGEQVFISYLDEGIQDSGRHSRQKWLREHYLFLCHCSRCLEQKDDASVTSEEEEEDEDME